MKEKMKAAVLYGLGDIRSEWVDIPQLGEDEILIKVKYCGICGSDVPRSMVTGARKYPLILGHEFSGTIMEIGKNSGYLKTGARVVVAPLVPCGKCRHCKASHYGLCDDYNIIGTGSDGAFAEYVKVPNNHVLPIDDRLDFETATGTEPASIGYHGLQKAAIQPGDAVVVIGCGPIGQLTLQWAKIFGATTVIAVDIFEDKLTLAKELGADITVNAKENNMIDKVRTYTEGGADVVAETAGSVITQQQAILAARKKGQVIFLGITHQGLALNKEAMDHIMRGEITIKGSWNSYTSPYPGQAWQSTLKHMGEGDIQFKPMISRLIGVDDLGRYLKKMADGTLTHNKVLVSF
ncbi:L-iditol 2-dehydrogenase [Geomicrobium halophilum]|uniref:L-iditol 2-dehydrogenase n=1 Tax=Geomicrobium halophilum TaxID=549000 RepID=A0A841PT18_9BACL|nr:galactitol-1-phosphate 5-dehydrogenase [Geomicrobium halophilum]MBB6450914.1 L-iditol 2-dehydrogenase [Geomicrobium halophilum]